MRWSLVLFVFMGVMGMPEISGDGGAVPALHRRCLRCLCEAATACQLNRGCEGGYCGPFKVARVYWVDADRPVFPDDDPQRAGAYEDCSRDYACASRIVRNYMRKFQKDCDGDDTVTCDDFMMIHYNGGYSCSTPINHTDHYRRYMECRPPQGSQDILMKTGRLTRGRGGGGR